MLYNTVHIAQESIVLASIELIHRGRGKVHPPTTRVPPDHSCPQEGGWCKCGSRNVVGWEIPVIDNHKTKIQQPKFQCFKCSNLQGDKASNIQSFEVSKVYFMFRWKILIPYYQLPISCFLEDIDPTFTILKK